MIIYSNLSFLDSLDEETYILTTDADVMFTPGSVEALLDLMTRDSSIGKVLRALISFFLFLIISHCPYS